MQYQFPVFENLCPGWEKHTHLGIRRIFSKDSQVFDIAKPIDGIYYVKKGSIEVILNTQAGPEKVLYYVGPGCIFGEVSCFVAGDSGEAHVRTRSDCEIYFFKKELIEGQIANNHPELLIEMIRAAAYKIRMYGILLQDSLASDHYVRVCKMLVYLAMYKDPGIPPGQVVVTIKPDITQVDMARLMGIHRITLTKAVSKLKKQGILEHFSKNKLVILNFPVLCTLTGGY